MRCHLPSACRSLLVCLLVLPKGKCLCLLLVLVLCWALYFGLVLRWGLVLWPCTLAEGGILEGYFVSGLCSGSLKLRTPADQTEIHEETIARNRLPLLVTDVSEVSVGKADSWIGLLTTRTSIKGDRSALCCDTPTVLLGVTSRSETTKLIVPSLLHMRDQIFQRSHMSRSRLIHTTTRLNDSISDARSASNRHVYKSAVYRRILVGDVVIHRSLLLFIYARHVKTLLSLMGVGAFTFSRTLKIE